jgi:hypothetical protein
MQNSITNTKKIYFSNPNSKCMGFSDNENHSSNNESINYNLNHFNKSVNSLENSFEKMKLNHPKKKNFSAGNLSNFTKKRKINNGKKTSLFNNKEKIQMKEESDEDLKTFIENLDVELYEYICSQKGSR